MTRVSKVLVVGSGGNAISAAVRLWQAGVSGCRIITAHSDFGGAWFANRYPGCGTDTIGFAYQLECALGAPWSSTYPNQPELLDYFRKVARDFGLYGYADFETEMTSCSWDSDALRWAVDTTQGRYFCQHLVLATGFLDQPIESTIPGAHIFGGRTFHSQHWPDGYTGEGDRIAVVGSGSSAIQIVPAMQAIARSVKAFQRTPTWVIPKDERHFSDEERERWTNDLDLLREERAKIDEQRKLAAKGRLGADPAFLDAMQAKALHFLEDQVKDPELRKLLTPDHNFGCKRRLVSDDWYWSLQQPNVELVPEAAARITADAIISQSGRRFTVDTIVLATGYRWGTQILDRVQRRDGQSVSQAQAGHPRAYKSIMVSKCPNLYLVGGPAPNGRSGGDGLRTGEIVSPYIVAAITHMDRAGVRALEVREEAETEWKRRADEVLAKGPATSGQCTNYITDKLGCNMAEWPGDYEHQMRQMSCFIAEDYQEPS